MKIAGFFPVDQQSIMSAQIVGHETIIFICMKFPMSFYLRMLYFSSQLQLKCHLMLWSEDIVEIM